MRASRLNQIVTRARILTAPKLANSRIFSTQSYALQGLTKLETLGVRYQYKRELSQIQPAFEHVKRFSEEAPVFLRDACQCTTCVDPSSHQRDFNFTDIPEDIQVNNVEYDSEKQQWSVTWTNDIPGYGNHVSHYSQEDIAQLLYNRQIGLSGRRDVSVWDAKLFERETRELDYQALLDDAEVLREALALIAKHGLIFIVNVPKDETAVMQLVNRLTGLYRNTFYGHSWDVRSVPQAKNVAYTSKVLDFHMDLLYMKEPPGLQLLHCLENSCTGGESEFVDAFKALDLMKTQQPELADILSVPQFNIRYGYDNDQHFYSDIKEVVKKKDLGRIHEPEWQVLNADNPAFIKSIERVYWSPPFINTINSRKQVTLVGDKYDNNVIRLNQQWFSATKTFAKLLRTPEFVYETKLPAGTCAVFDNLRVLHARKAFDVNSGKRWLKGVYGDAQDLRSMTQKHVWANQPEYSTKFRRVKTTRRRSHELHASKSDKD